jgi:uncharacterized membrane protein
MNFSDDILPTSWLWGGQLLFWPALLFAAFRAPWWHLKDNESLHVLLGAAVSVLVLWMIQADVASGIKLHLLGATILTLMFGWQFAMLSLALVLLGAAANDAGGWMAFGVNGVLLAVLPVVVSWSIYRAVERYLPHHFFVYVFAGAFFGGAVSIGFVGFATIAVLALSDVYGIDYLVEHYLAFYLLLLFPEAFITGALMTILIAYRPQWVSSFSDERYLKSK